MEVIVGRAEVTLAGVGEGLASDHAPIVPSAYHGRVRPHPESSQRLLKSEPIENSRRVRTYLDAGADLAQFGGLLEHLNLEARTPKRQRGSEASDPRSYHDDSHGRQRFAERINYSFVVMPSVLPVPAVMPPSITSACPVTNDASSEARNSTHFAISIGLPILPSG